MSEPLDLEILANMSDSQLLNEGRDMILAEVHRLRTPSPVGTAPIEPAQPPASNRYGLDVAYFTAELSRLTDSLSDRPPEELARYLRTLADAAARPEVDLGEIEDILYDLISELNGLEDNEDAAEAAITEAAKALAALPPSPASTTTNGDKNDH